MFLHIEQLAVVNGNNIASFHICESVEGDCRIVVQENRFFGPTAPTNDVLRDVLAARFREVQRVAPEAILGIGEVHPKPPPRFLPSVHCQNPDRIVL